MNAQIGPDGIYEIYEFYYKPFWQTTMFQVLFGILLLSALVSFLLWIFVWHKNRKLAPWDWALLEICKLPIDKCHSKDDFKRFYFLLTGVIKRYLYKRFNWDTIDKTDDELIKFLQNKKFDIRLLESLQKVFDGAVWVKFANEDVLKTQAESDLLVARDVIEKTRPSGQK